MLRFRMATRQDSTQVVALLNDTFRTPIDEATWEWYVYGNPRGASRVYVGLEENADTIAGVVGFSPTQLKLHSDYLPADYAHHLALKPAYRETLSYLAIMRYALEGEASEGVKIAIGPPNRRAYPIHKALTKWVDFGFLDCLRKLSPSAKENRCQELKTFPESFNNLYQQVSEQMSFCIGKTAEWMNWRFCRRPGSPYTVYALSSGYELTGYIVLKRWEDPDGYRKAHILDFHALDEAALSDLMAAAESYAADCDELNLWAVQGYLYGALLERMGFVPGVRQPLIARPFNGFHMQYPSGHCSLSYGDGDTLY